MVAVVLPPAVFAALLAGQEPFRTHVFGLLAERGLVPLSREQVEIVDAARLRELAAPA